MNIFINISQNHTEYATDVSLLRSYRRPNVFPVRYGQTYKLSFFFLFESLFICKLYKYIQQMV
jgi:hypothetical protein